VSARYKYEKSFVPDNFHQEAFFRVCALSRVRELTGPRKTSVPIKKEIRPAKRRISFFSPEIVSHETLVISPE
jgi:hypothetical protein